MLHDTAQGHSYGDTIPVNFNNIYKDGSQKRFKNRHYNSLEVNVDGGKFHEDYGIAITQKPKGQNIKVINVNYEYSFKEKNFNKTQKIRLSFNKKLVIDFSGKDGIDKNDRGGRLINSIIGKDGRTGKDADNGTDGKDGSSIYVKIWKEKNSKDLYTILVKNLDNGEKFYYNYSMNEQPIIIKSDGGNGGDGGDAGDGADGDDAEIEDGEAVAPGSGGGGGNGGDAGSGGDGGNIIVDVHTNARSLMKKIKLKNQGGKPGKPGKPGEGGEAGTPLEDGATGEDGTPGQPGQPGEHGKSGEQKKITVKEFNIQ